MKKQNPTVDGIKFATSTKWTTTMSYNNWNTDNQMFQPPCPRSSMPPKLNVGMRLKESGLCNLRVWSDLTLRPLYATQHLTYGARRTQQAISIWFVRVHWCCEFDSATSLLECGQWPLTYAFVKQECKCVHVWHVCLCARVWHGRRNENRWFLLIVINPNTNVWRIPLIYFCPGSNIRTYFFIF